MKQNNNMKKIIFQFLVLAPVCAFSQEFGYTVKGKLGEWSAPAKVYLRYVVNGNVVYDSVLLDKGNFSFSGKISEPVRAGLSANYTGQGRAMDGMTIYLEKGNIKVSSKDSLKNASVKGGSVNEDQLKLQAALKNATDRNSSLMARYDAMSAEQKKDKEIMAGLNAEMKTITEDRREVLRKFIAANPASLVSLDALKSYAGAIPKLEEIEPLFQQLSPGIKASASGKEYANRIASIKATAIGALAPEFIQNDPEGKPVSLSSFRGKYVLIDFWASWCGPCRAENPNVVKVYNQYKDKNFTVLGVSLDQPGAKEKWLKAISDDQLTWTHVSDLKYWNNEVAQQYGISAIPQNFLLDPSGKIVAKNIRGEALEKAVAEKIK
jgi:peroxiredoxin